MNVTAVQALVTGEAPAVCSATLTKSVSTIDNVFDTLILRPLR